MHAHRLPRTETLTQGAGLASDYRPLEDDAAPLLLAAPCPPSIDKVGAPSWSRGMPVAAEWHPHKWSKTIKSAWRSPQRFQERLIRGTPS